MPEFDNQTRLENEKLNTLLCALYRIISALEADATLFVSVDIPADLNQTLRTPSL